jgi:hypothetical protein
MRVRNGLSRLGWLLLAVYEAGWLWFLAVMLYSGGWPRWDDLLSVLALMTLVPLAVWLLFRGLCWVAAGFRDA